MKRKTELGALIALTALVSATVWSGCFPCGGVERETPAVRRAQAPEPVLVFEDQFDRSYFGENWQIASTSWEIRDGEVRVMGARNSPAWLLRPLPDKVRVEFEALAESDDGDIKFEIFGDGYNHESGYIGIFGGWRNSYNIIARLDEHGTDRVSGRRDMKVERDRWYRFRIERTSNRLQWFIDDEPFLEFDDVEALRGAGHLNFAFSNWTAPLRFKNLRIWDLEP